MSKPGHPSARMAEEAFYRAFEAGDIEAMQAVWAAGDEVACVHPGGKRLDGSEAVLKSWEQIFASGDRLRFRLLDRRRVESGGLAVHNLVEEITVVGDDAPSGRVIATNVYRLEEDGWRMILHHAAPLPRLELAAPDPEPASGTLH